MNVIQKISRLEIYNDVATLHYKIYSFLKYKTSNGVGDCYIVICLWLMPWSYEVMYVIISCLGGLFVDSCINGEGSQSWSIWAFGYI